MEQGTEPLIGMTLAELREAATSLGLPAFAGGQMARWMYGRGVDSIDSMTDISKANRERLKGRYRVGCMPPLGFQESSDGTRKYLFPTADGQRVETVYIPDGERATLCVSSQVGCRMGCVFCMTGRQGFHGNLTAGDIINQVYSLPERSTLTNIVFMGQGEPLDNADAVLKAVGILTSGYGYAWSPRRITISSVGLRKGLPRLMEETDCHVAISLHFPTHGQRSLLMPAERAMPIEEIVATLRDHDFSHQRRLSFEYIMFGGLNDSLSHAGKVARLLRGLECRVNLIRFHRIPESGLHESTQERMEAFRDHLTARGTFTTIRASRGQDIMAACGLLSTGGKEGGTSR